METPHLRELRRNAEQRDGLDATGRGHGPLVSLYECSIKFLDSIK